MTGAVGWQESIARFVQEHQTVIVAIGVTLVVAAVGVSLTRRRREHAG